VAAVHESFFGGQLSLRQAARGAGYRTNVDALLLCREAQHHAPIAHVLDLGSGTGIVGLALCSLGAASRVTLVEKDPLAAALARENARRFASADVRETDVAELGSSVGADVVVCNPPYTPSTRGRPALEPRRAMARQGDLAPFLAAARYHLRPGGSRAIFVYPAADLTTLVRSASQAGLHPITLRFVHARPVRSVARIVLLTLAPARGAFEVLPPWYEWIGTEREPSLASFLAGASSPVSCRAP